MKTRVIFRKFRTGGDLIALLPHEPGTNDPATLTCYQHQGQHGSIREDAVSRLTVTAVPSEYADLLSELGRVGYTDLDIRMNLTTKDYGIRKKAISDSSIPNRGSKPFTVIGYYPDNHGWYNGHYKSNSAASLEKFVGEEIPELVIVDILAGHHMSQMEGR